MAWVRPVLLGVVAAFGAFVLGVVTKVPRHDRDWYPHLSRLPHVDLADGIFSIAPYGDWTYTEDVPKDTVWTAVPPHRISDVRRVWFVMEPHPGLPLMAHTFVMFEFGEETWSVSPSRPARRPAKSIPPSPARSTSMS